MSDAGGGAVESPAGDESRVWEPACLHREGAIGFDEAACGCVENAVVVRGAQLGLRLQASRKPWIPAKVVQLRPPGAPDDADTEFGSLHTGAVVLRLESRDTTRHCLHGSYASLVGSIRTTPRPFRAIFLCQGVCPATLASGGAARCVRQHMNPAKLRELRSLQEFALTICSQTPRSPVANILHSINVYVANETQCALAAPASEAEVESEACLRGVLPRVRSAATGDSLREGVYSALMDLVTGAVQPYLLDYTQRQQLERARRIRRHAARVALSQRAFGVSARHRRADEWQAAVEALGAVRRAACFSALVEAVQEFERILWEGFGQGAEGCGDAAAADDVLPVVAFVIASALRQGRVLAPLPWLTLLSNLATESAKKGRLGYTLSTLEAGVSLLEHEEARRRIKASHGDMQRLAEFLGERDRTEVTGKGLVDWMMEYLPSLARRQDAVELAQCLVWAHRLTHMLAVEEFDEDAVYCVHQQPPTVRHGGWLLKQSDVLRAWRPRFFLLLDRALTYHRQVGDAVRRERHVDGCHARLIRAEAGGDDACEFHLVWPGGESVCLRASSEADRDQWLQALSRAMELPPNPSKATTAPDEAVNLRGELERAALRPLRDQAV